MFGSSVEESEARKNIVIEARHYYIVKLTTKEGEKVEKIGMERKKQRFQKVIHGS